MYIIIIKVEKTSKIEYLFFNGFSQNDRKNMFSNYK